MQVFISLVYHFKTIKNLFAFLKLKMVSLQGGYIWSEKKVEHSYHPDDIQV